MSLRASRSAVTAVRYVAVSPSLRIEPAEAWILAVPPAVTVSIVMLPVVAVAVMS